MHPRACVSAISTFACRSPKTSRSGTAHGIDTSACRSRSSTASAGKRARALVADAVDGGLRVANLIGLGPFNLANPASWAKQQDRLVHSVDAAVAGRRRCIGVHDGPVRAAHVGRGRRRLEAALAPVLRHAHAASVPFAIEHTNSLRVDVGFVHTLKDAIDLARRLDVGVCMEINACWAERGLDRTIRAGIDRIRLVQVSDFRSARSRRRNDSCPATAISRSPHPRRRARRRIRRACSISS